MKNLITLVFLLGFHVSNLMAQEYRDVVFLKNGSVIKGFYNEIYTDDSLRMKTIDGGYLVCAFSDIKRIVKEKNEVYLLRKTEDEERVWRPKGYSGQVEYGLWQNTKNRGIYASSFEMTHGYQFNRIVFLGGGVGVERISLTNESYTLTQSGVNVPVYADMRLYVLPNRVAPFLDLKGGYTVLGVKGGYSSASLGIDFSITPRLGIYGTVGYYVMQIHDQKYRDEDGKEFAQNISMKLGIRF